MDRKMQMNTIEVKKRELSGTTCSGDNAKITDGKKTTTTMTEAKQGDYECEIQ